MKPERNDNNHETVKRLQERLQAGAALASYLDLQAVAGALVEEGAHWRGSDSTGLGGAAPAGSVESSALLNYVFNHVSSVVRNIEGRLRVYDFTKHFAPVETDGLAASNPHLDEKVFMLRAYHARWQFGSREEEFAALANRRRCVAGHSVHRWRFRGDTTGVRDRKGLQLDFQPARIVTDPRILVPSLWEHPYVIDARVYSLDEANAYFRDALKAKGRYPLTGGTKIGDLIGADEYTSRVIDRRTLGIRDSDTPGVLVFEMFEKEWSRLATVLFIPARVETDGKRSEQGYHLLYDGDWEYGCPYLKLDAYADNRCAYGRSIPLGLAGPQNVLNLLLRSELRAVLFSALYKIVVVQSALVGPEDVDAVKSNKSGAMVRIHPGADPDRAFQYKQPPRVDPLAQGLRALATDALYREASMPAILQAEAVPRESYASYLERRKEALTPLEPTAATDQARYEEFYANMLHAGLRYHGLGGSRKSLVILLGKKYAGKVGLDRMRKIIESGPVRCHMKASAFRPRPPIDIAQEMWGLIKAGRASAEDARWLIQYHLRTGWEIEHGQAEANWAAHVLVRQILGEAEQIGESPELLEDLAARRVGPYDPLDWIEQWARTYLVASVLDDFSPAQVLALQLTIAECERERFLMAQKNAAMAALQQSIQAPATPPEGTSGATAPLAPEAAMAGSPGAIGAPAVGEPVAMVG